MGMSQESDPCRGDNADAGEPRLRIDRQALILSANAAARALLRRHPAFARKDDKLTPRRAEEVTALRLALEGLAPGARRIVCLRARQGGPVVLIKLWAEMEDVVQARIVDLLTPALPDLSLLAEAFALTPMEARVAGLLSIGVNVEEMAERLELRAGTVRSHLKSAMAKTESRSQTRLALLVVRAVP